MDLFGRKKIKELEAKLKIAQADNIILLENAEELRAKIRGLECILEAEKEKKDEQPKKRGRKKKESTENS